MPVKPVKDYLPMVIIVFTVILLAFIAQSVIVGYFDARYDARYVKTSQMEVQFYDVNRMILQGELRYVGEAKSEIESAESRRQLTRIERHTFARLREQGKELQYKLDALERKQLAAIR
jgi:hypothetical protein